MNRRCLKHWPAASNRRTIDSERSEVADLLKLLQRSFRISCIFVAILTGLISKARPGASAVGLIDLRDVGY